MHLLKSNRNDNLMQFWKQKLSPAFDERGGKLLDGSFGVYLAIRVSYKQHFFGCPELCTLDNTDSSLVYCPLFPKALGLVIFQASRFPQMRDVAAAS